MLPVPLRRPPPRLELREVGLRPAALDEIGERLGGRAGDVDAAGAQVRDHAGPRGAHGEAIRRRDRAVTPLERTRGDLGQLEELERLAQLGEIDALLRLELSE